MTTVLGIIIGVFLLTLVIFTHELGHYWAGRKLGFKIIEFAIGFGPKLFSRVGKNGIRYSLRAFPIGGYCKFYGEDQEITDSQGAFNNQKLYKRAIVIAAGGISNLIAALLLAIIFTMVAGNLNPPAPVIDQITPLSSAQQLGLKNGDQIMSIYGIKVKDTVEVFEIIHDKNAKKVGNRVPVTIKRGEQLLNMKLVYKELGKGNIVLGFSFIKGGEKLSFWQSIPSGCEFAVRTVKDTYKGLGRMFINGNIKDVAGPIGMVSMVEAGIQDSPMYTIILFFIGISISLGVLNLLPLPALDGGRLVFLGIEAIFKKPIKREVEAIIHIVGLILFLLLAVVIAANDISRISGR